jgi:uncharacterized membrane protein YdjX (TVP38/TMEM64 family)
VRRISAGTRLAIISSLIVTAAVIVAISVPHSVQTVQDQVDRFGSLAPVVFVALAIPLCSAFLPVPLMGNVAGLAFGTLAGTGLTLLCGMGTATLSFFIARRTGKAALEEIARTDKAGWHERLEDQPFLTVLRFRVVPLVPFTLVSYAAGLSRLRWLPFAAATALGFAPRAFAFAAIGANLDDPVSPTAFGAFAITVALAVATLIVVRRSEPGRGSSSPGGRSEARP